MAMGTRESAQTWTFGSSTGGGLNTPSTGAGTAFNTHNLGEQFTFFVYTDASATCSYQIRSAPTAAGPWVVLSSGVLAAAEANVVQSPGPLGWLSPRIETINSTANTVTVRMTAL